MNELINTKLITWDIIKGLKVSREDQKYVLVSVKLDLVILIDKKGYKISKPKYLAAYLNKEGPNFVKPFTNNISLKYRQVKTFNNLDFDVAKSALQKYIRRGNTNKAIWMACELDIFRFFEGKSQWTNFYNRLRVTYLEDIGLANKKLLIKMDKLLKLWSESDKPSVELLELISRMSTSPHTRFYSHIKAYTLDKIKRDYFKIEETKNSYKYEDKKLQDSINGLIWCIENKNRYAYFFINEILNKEKLDYKVQGNTRPGFLIFDILEKIKINKTITICKEWYKTLKVKEQFLCCMHAVYSLIIDIDNDVIFTDEDLDISTYKENFTNKTIVLNDYIYDMHNKEGKKLGRNSVNFAIEGSLVSYEVLIDQEAKDYYIRKKVRDGTVQKESDEFKLKARAQLVCSASRQDTYFAKNLLNQNVVVKGPYEEYDKALETFKIQSLLRLFSGVNVLDANVMLLYSDMFDGKNNPKSALGCRNKLDLKKPLYFIELEDLFNQLEYPTIKKSSKVWPETEVVDYETFFTENEEYGFGTVEGMNDEMIDSFLLQITVRYIMELGDFAMRNFLRVGSRVYNLDTEGIEIGDKIRFSGKQKDILRKNLKNNEYIEHLEQWLTNDMIWYLIKVVYGEEYSNKVKDRLEKVITNAEIMFE